MASAGTSFLTASDLRKAVRCVAAFAIDEHARPTAETVIALDTYILAIRFVNERLGESDRLIQLGQRSEALRLLQLDQDVLGFYREICFHGHESLVEACEDFKLSIPPKIDAELARRIDEAYELENQQLQSLRDHRLLALGRAPLQSRLVVIRSIAKKFPREFFWAEDIVAYELKWYEDIKTKLSKEDYWDDSDLVLEMHEMAKGARTPMPIEVYDLLVRARTHLATKGILSIIDEIHMAELEENSSRVKKLISEAYLVLIKYELPKNLTAMTPVYEAEQRCREHEARCREFDAERRELEARQQFNYAVKKLRDAMKDDMDVNDVGELYLSAHQHPYPLPEAVIADYRNYVNRKRFWTRKIEWVSRLFNNIVILIGIAVNVIIAIIIFLVIAGSR